MTFFFRHTHSGINYVKIKSGLYPVITARDSPKSISSFWLNPQVIMVWGTNCRKTAGQPGKLSDREVPGGTQTVTREPSDCSLGQTE